MIFKLSKTLTNDHSGAGTLQTIHCYSALKKKVAGGGSYIKSSIKTLHHLPNRIRGKRYRPLRVGYIVCSFITNIRKKKSILSSIQIFNNVNTSVILKRKGLLKSPYVFGPISRPLHYKQFAYMFNYCL